MVHPSIDLEPGDRVEVTAYVERTGKISNIGTFVGFTVAAEGFVASQFARITLDEGVTLEKAWIGYVRKLSDLETLAESGGVS